MTGGLRGRGRRWVLRTAWWAAFPALAAAPAGAHQAEPEFPCLLGLPGNLVYGAHTEGCALAAGDSVDPFGFAAAEGDAVRLVGHAQAPGLDLYLRVEDPLGGLLDEGACDGGTAEAPLAPCSVRLDFAAASGSHVVEVRDLGGDEAGGYVLQLEVLPGYDSDAVIDRDSFVDAEVIDPTTDVDQYGVVAQTGDTVGILIESLSPAFDPHVELFAPSGEWVVEGGCEGAAVACSFELEATVAETGTFFFTVFDLGADLEGIYRYTVTRVPEPAAGGAGLSAAAALAALAAGAGGADPRRQSSNIRVSVS